MTSIEIVKAILSHIGDDPDQDRALAQGCIVILGGADEPTPPMDDVAKSKKAEPKSKPKKRPPFDTGKLKALREGGWPVAKIADEMGVSEQTVRNYIAKLGL